MELGDKEENQEKAVPVSDKENKQTFNASIKPTLPSCARYWLTCSHVVLSSSPIELTKIGGALTDGIGN
jgi:hypothetical protein